MTPYRLVLVFATLLVASCTASAPKLTPDVSQSARNPVGTPPPSGVGVPLPLLPRLPFPAHVAVVLPADGSAALSAVAVRDGLLAAWYATSPSERPTITFHPFTGGAVNVAYQAAVQSGASLVIGPLGKEEVQSLARAGVSRPTLALNYLPDGVVAPAQLYQFGLSPTDEARQGAKQAWLDGRTRAFVATPNDEWGKRVRQAFRLQWEAIGGSTFYAMNTDDHPEALLATMGRIHDPALSRGKGGDFVFLAAPPELAHRLLPALREAGLPVYATSHILTGGSTDNELSGMPVQVIDMPWLVAPNPTDARLRAEIERLWPASFITYRRLYALGVDAFRLAAELPALEKNPSDRVAGATGSLALDTKRQVVRQGVWAHIEGGRLTPVAVKKD